MKEQEVLKIRMLSAYKTLMHIKYEYGGKEMVRLGGTETPMTCNARIEKLKIAAKKHGIKMKE